MDNPLSIPILKLLTKKQLSIPQITKSLQNIDADMQSVIAVLGELYHFGLIERFEPPAVNSPTQNQISSEELLQDPWPKIYTTPLGIPLYDYVSLWEEVVQHPNRLNSSKINSWIFTIPNYLRKEIENLTLEEIRLKLLKKSH
ncbi:MAG: hypothetical protein JSU57_06495 [Candidatus Heimdallarchaeota archaeon]|nr:MAG: hypothetical protein JSU57_06495 [Candidatus Heimdallarchaeota archaeon]